MLWLTCLIAPAWRRALSCSSDACLVFVRCASLQAFDVPTPGLAGYHYTARFLDDYIVDTSNSHVRPVFKHLIHPQYKEALTFIGLPYKIVPFPQFELQTKFVARLLSGRAQLPSDGEMSEWMEHHYRCAQRVWLCIVLLTAASNVHSVPPRQTFRLARLDERELAHRHRQSALCDAHAVFSRRRASRNVTYTTLGRISGHTTTGLPDSVARTRHRRLLGACNYGKMLETTSASILLTTIATNGTTSRAYVLRTRLSRLKGWCPAM